MKKTGKFYVKDWVEKLQTEGRISFTLEEMMESFLGQKDSALKNALNRLAQKGKVCSVWKGFYVIVPIEHRSKGIVPPVMFIDSLMIYLKRSYYVALLNAAAFYGAAHQQPQDFSIISSPPSLRATEKKNLRISFLTKNNIPESQIRKFKTQTGYLNVSSPELTSMDLVIYEKVIGGLSRACTVLNELAEQLDFESVESSFFQLFQIQAFQRLGYLLDAELGYNELADQLFLKIREYGNPFRRTMLKNRKSALGCPTNNKWKVVINENIEIDE